MSFQRFIGLAACTGLVAAASSAQTLNFSFTIDGLQEVPPTSSNAIGRGIVSLNTATNEIQWDISWSILSGPATAMHFHGPAAPGSNASPQVNIGLVSGLTSPSVGSATVRSNLAADLTAGLWYVNIHSAQFPGGEIRGQVTPAPGAIGLLAGFGMIAMRRRRR